MSVFNGVIVGETTEGIVTAPASISGTGATISTGSNKITLTKTVSVTPNVTKEGYISQGTTGSSSVSLSATATIKSATIWTPTTSNQTISSGTYCSGTQTIKGDSNLTAENIKSGVSIFGVSGSYAGSGGTVYTATGSSVSGSYLEFNNLVGEPKLFVVLYNSDSYRLQFSSSSKYIMGVAGTLSSAKCTHVQTEDATHATIGHSTVAVSYSSGILRITPSSGNFYDYGSLYSLWYIV